MSREQSLMHPLNSDSLKPRASAEAVWAPGEPLKSHQPPEPEPEIASEAPQEEEPQAEPSVDSIIAEILADDEDEDDDDDDDDDDDLLPAHDALPSRFMPEPVCIPLYEQPQPKRRRKGWIWLAALAVIAGAVCAAVHFGLLSINWP